MTQNTFLKPRQEVEAEQNYLILAYFLLYLLSTELAHRKSEISLFVDPTDRDSP